MLAQILDMTIGYAGSELISHRSSWTENYCIKLNCKTSKRTSLDLLESAHILNASSISWLQRFIAYTALAKKCIYSGGMVIPHIIKKYFYVLKYMGQRLDIVFWCLHHIFIII